MKRQSVGGRKLFAVTALVYAGLLLAVVGLGAAFFRELYLSQSRSTLVELSGDYGRFLRLAGVALAVYAAVWAAGFGIWRKSWLQGLAALAGGALITIASFSVLPWVYFAHDQYAAPAAWMFNSAFPILITWILVSLMGRVWNRASTA